MANYAVMADSISNSAGNGPPNFPFGITVPAGAPTNLVKDLANGATYTITNTDGFNYFTSSVALTGSNKGFILPVAANNIGRRLVFKRTDTAGNATTAGNGILMTVATQGSDIIDSAGYTITSLISQGAYLEVIAESVNTWRVVNCSDFMSNYYSGITSVANGTTANLFTIIIPSSGEWDISSAIQMQSQPIQQLIYAISTTSAPSFTPSNWAENMFNTQFTSNIVYPNTVTLTFRQKISTATTYYGIYVPTYTGSTPTVAAKFYARRWS